MVIINQTIINNLAAKINAKEKQSNKTTTISSSSTDTQYPSAKAVYTALQSASGEGATVDIDYYFDTTGKELVFEYENINGINEGNSLSVSIATSWGSPTSDEKVPSEALVKSALDGKAASDHTHSQYLTEHQSLANYVTTNDSRLSDARTPTTHTHTKSQITDFPTMPTIADNLTTNDSSQVLSAKQGKVLNDLIGSAITYINQ